MYSWIKLAEEAERMAQWEASRGRYAGVYLNKARTYRNAAKSIELTEATGVFHCACHLKPVDFFTFGGPRNG